MEKQKTSVLGKVFTIFSGIMMIVMVTGKWLELHQIPMILKNSVQDEYSLFEIAKFLDKFSLYLDRTDIEIYAAVLGFGAVAVIILSVLTMITALLNSSAAKGFGGAATGVCVILTVLFMISIIDINLKMKDATYGGIDELLRSTARPFVMILFSIFGIVGTCLKAKPVQAGVMPHTANAGFGMRRCTECGAEITAGTCFCAKCGKPVEEVRKTVSNEKYCTVCGAKIAPEMRFCTSCGAKADF